MGSFSSQQLQVLQQACSFASGDAGERLQLLHTLHMLLSTQAAAAARVYGKHRLPYVAEQVSDLLVTSLDELSLDDCTPEQGEDDTDWDAPWHTLYRSIASLR
jgi:hypothetical protein